jgi:hypothetical protein
MVFYGFGAVSWPEVKWAQQAVASESATFRAESFLAVAEAANHDVSLFDHSGGNVAFLELQFVCSVGRNDGCYLVLADCQHDLGEETCESDAFNFAPELIHSGDLRMPFARLGRSWLSFDKGLEACGRNAMVAARGLNGLESPIENAFLDGRVADSHHLCSGARGQ